MRVMRAFGLTAFFSPQLEYISLLIFRHCWELSKFLPKYTMRRGKTFSPSFYLVTQRKPSHRTPCPKTICLKIKEMIISERIRFAGALGLGDLFPGLTAEKARHERLEAVLERVVVNDRTLVWRMVIVSWRRHKGLWMIEDDCGLGWVLMF